MSEFDRVIEITGGVSALAARLGVRQSVISNWRARGRVPAERVIDVEVATGGQITRYELRPDVFGTAPPPDLQASLTPNGTAH